MKQQSNGVRQLLIIAAAALLANIGFSIYNDVRVMRKYEQQVEQNTNELHDKADATRIDEVMKLMKDYHDVAMKAIETNDIRYREEMNRISLRIDVLQRDVNAVRGIE